MVNANLQDTFSRWIRQGAPLHVGVVVLLGLVIRLICAVPLAKLANPIAFLAVLQMTFYMSMYPARKRYRDTGDLRVGFTLMGLYCLLLGLAGMYYAGKLGLAAVETFNDNYLGFSIYVIVVVCIGVGLLSLLKSKRPKPHSW